MQPQPLPGWLVGVPRGGCASPTGGCALGSGDTGAAGVGVASGDSGAVPRGGCALGWVIAVGCVVAVGCGTAIGVVVADGVAGSPDPDPAQAVSKLLMAMARRIFMD